MVEGKLPESLVSGLALAFAKCLQDCSSCGNSWEGHWASTRIPGLVPPFWEGIGWRLSGLTGHSWTSKLQLILDKHNFWDELDCLYKNLRGLVQFYKPRPVPYALWGKCWEGERLERDTTTCTILWLGDTHRSHCQEGRSKGGLVPPKLPKVEDLLASLNVY